jgi:2-keto-4-pentenoate hydratase
MRPFDDARIVRGMGAQFDRRRSRIEAGDKRFGWKVGFTAPAMMEKLKITSPLVGSLMQSAVVPSGGTVSLTGWTKPALEPEVAVYMGKDLPGGSDRAAASGAIGGLSPAIELVDVTFAPEDVEAILGANVYQRHVVLGPRAAPRAGAAFDGLAATVLRNGAEVARATDAQANVGNILDTVRHVADTLAEFGERLAAGDVIITGSITPPFHLGPGDKGVDFTLDPIGTVSVRFSA